jgi:hypothetical protein
MVSGRTRYKRAQALADGGSDTGGKKAAGSEKQAGSAEGYVHIVPLKMHMLVPMILLWLPRQIPYLSSLETESSRGCAFVCTPQCAIDTSARWQVRESRRKMKERCSIFNHGWSVKERNAYGMLTARMTCCGRCDRLRLRLLCLNGIVRLLVDQPRLTIVVPRMYDESGRRPGKRNR